MKTSEDGEVAKRAVAGVAVERRRQWRDRLRRFERSGQSVAAFCKAESVSAWSFYDWRRRLGAGSGRVNRCEGARSGGFVEVGTVRAPRVEAPAAEVASIAEPVAMELRIELGGGVVLRLLRG